MKSFVQIVNEHVDIVAENYQSRQCDHGDMLAAMSYLDGLITRLWRHYRRMDPHISMRPEQGLNCN